MIYRPPVYTASRQEYTHITPTEQSSRMPSPVVRLEPVQGRQDLTAKPLDMTGEAAFNERDHAESIWLIVGSSKSETLRRMLLAWEVGPTRESEDSQWHLRIIELTNAENPRRWSNWGPICTVYDLKKEIADGARIMPIGRLSLEERVRLAAIAERAPVRCMQYHEPATWNNQDWIIGVLRAGEKEGLLSGAAEKVDEFANYD
ncbi:hypothetical protein BDW22DRAFT_1482701 [Trametopsis cervina]|nr:hypothetical protein BDW22DRAFT_1482701 [Trametopsis cervina]